MGRWAALVAGWLLLAIAAPAQETEPQASQGATAFATVADAGQARAALYVLDEFLDTTATLETMARRYAPVVSYYGQGAVPLEAVLADKAAYLQRWPVRRAQPDLPTLTVSSRADDVYDVSVVIDFEVENGAAGISGRSVVEVSVRERDDSFEVIAEGGRVLSRERRQ